MSKICFFSIFINIMPKIPCNVYPYIVKNGIYASITYRIDLYNVLNYNQQRYRCLSFHKTSISCAIMFLLSHNKFLASL